MSESEETQSGQLLIWQPRKRKERERERKEKRGEGVEDEQRGTLH